MRRILVFLFVLSSVALHPLAQQDSKIWKLPWRFLESHLIIYSSPSQKIDPILPDEADIWESIGPSGGGWLTAAAFSPPNTIYIGSDIAGVHRSRDGGESWQIINNGLKNYNVMSIAVDPQVPSTIYLGTLGGVYRSTDGGDHWELKRQGFPPLEPYSFSAPIACLAIDPQQPSTLYAAIGDPHDHRFGQGTIYKSLDWGENWFVVNQGANNIHAKAIVYSIAIDPLSSERLYVSTDYGLYQSEDGGVTWEARNSGLPHSNTRKVVIHPFDPDILYLTIRSPPGQGPWQGGVYKSINGALSWSPVNNGLESDVGHPDKPEQLTSNYEQIIIDPLDPNMLYVGDVSWTTPGVYKSTDGGNSWGNTIDITNLHAGIWDWVGPSVETLLIDPINPARLFFGNSMELYLSQDAGGSWWQTYSNEVPTGSGWWQGRGLETTIVANIAIDPTNSQKIYFGFLDVGFLKSEDGGITFKHSNQDLKYGSVFSIAVDERQPNILYASNAEWETNQGEIVRSDDYGETWTVVGDWSSGLPGARISALVLDSSGQVEPRPIYAASNGEGVYKSIDGGLSWEVSNNGLGMNGNQFVTSLVMDPSRPNMIYAGVDMGEADADRYGGIYKTIDAGANWVQVDTGIPNVLYLAIDQDNPRIIYAAAREHFDDINQLYFEGGVYRSMDGGSSWDQVFSDVFVQSVAIDPQNSQIVYAGTADHPFHDQSSGKGVFRSIDGGNSWHPLNAGLGNLSISTLEIDPNNPNLIFAGTGGSGIFKGHIPDR